MSTKKFSTTPPKSVNSYSEFQILSQPSDPRISKLTITPYKETLQGKTHKIYGWTYLVTLNILSNRTERKTLIPILDVFCMRVFIKSAMLNQTTYTTRKDVGLQVTGQTVWKYITVSWRIWTFSYPIGKLKTLISESIDRFGVKYY